MELFYYYCVIDWVWKEILELCVLKIIICGNVLIDVNL